MPSYAQPIAVKEKTAAEMLDMAATEFRRLVQRGSLPPPANLAGMERWRVADLEAVLSGQASKPEEHDDFE